MNLVQFHYPSLLLCGYSLDMHTWTLTTSEQNKTKQNKTKTKKKCISQLGFLTTYWNQFFYLIFSLISKRLFFVFCFCFFLIIISKVFFFIPEVIILKFLILKCHCCRQSFFQTVVFQSLLY